MPAFKDTAMATSLRRAVPRESTGRFTHRSRSDYVCAQLNPLVEHAPAERILNLASSIPRWNGRFSLSACRTRTRVRTCARREDVCRETTSTKAIARVSDGDRQRCLFAWTNPPPVQLRAFLCGSRRCRRTSRDILDHSIVCGDTSWRIARRVSRSLRAAARHIPGRGRTPLFSDRHRLSLARAVEERRRLAETATTPSRSTREGKEHAPMRLPRGGKPSPISGALVGCGPTRPPPPMPPCSLR